MTAPRPWTPGRWTWWTSNSWRRLRSEDGRFTHEVIQPFVSRNDGHPSLMVSEANMALIASAPDLYEALEEWVALRDAVAEVGGMDGPLAQETIDAFAERQRLVVDRARAALSKARGEQKETP